MSDHYTEYERTGFLGNMGNSFSNMILGFIIFLASFVVHWWNEGRAVDRYTTLETGQKNLVQTKSFDPKNNGKLVFVGGKLELATPATDPAFAVKHEDAVKVYRRIEMYQWDERKSTRTTTNAGGSKTKKTTYSYDKKWSDRLINSNSFNQKYRSKYKNPSKKEPSKSFYAKDVKVKGYSINESQINMLSSMKKPNIPSSAKIPDHMASNAKNLSSYIFVSRNGSSSLSTPQIGDYRISFQYLPTSEVSIIAEQADGGLKPYKTDSGDLIEVREGKMTSDEIFKKATEENKMLTWILRGVGLLAMTIGLAMCASPLQALFNVIPFLGTAVGAITGFFAFIIALLLSSVTIAVAWFAHRPMLSLALIGGGVAVWFLFRMMQPSKDQRMNSMAR